MNFISLVVLTSFIALVKVQASDDVVKHINPNHNRRGIHELGTTIFQNPFTIPLSAPNCPEANYKLNCDYNIRYRTLDGSCNNLKYKWWGARLTPYQRLLEHDYSKLDGPKTSNRFKLLPGSETIAKVIPTNVEAKSALSSLYTWFGQFVAYDMAFTAKSNATCLCAEAATKTDPDCFNIDADNQGGCKPFPRSDDVRDTFGCSFKHREQFSKVTHWLDMDTMYGSNYKQSELVRAYDKGKLKWSVTPGTTPKENLPVLDKNICLDTVDTKSKGCIYAADSRVDESALTTAMHVLFLREHNRIASKLFEKNQHWNDQILYSEARRILNAIYQNIIYAEYLPPLLGEHWINEFGLYTFDTGYAYAYDDYLYPNNYNEFIAAGFKLDQITAPKFTTTTAGEKELTVFFSNQFYTYTKMNELLDGLIKSATLAQRFNVVEAIPSLSTFNIQLGRDHGLRPYVYYRKMAGLNLPATFDELFEMDSAVITILKGAYTDVNDIDLWVGLMAEPSKNDALIGHTQSFLVAKNFFSHKYGDRFYFENGDDKINRFTEGQLKELRNYRMANLLCQTTGATNVPTRGFYVTDVTKNPDVKCADLKDIDFEYWREFKDRKSVV